MPYENKHEKHIWNRGYFAGHRHMIMMLLAYRDTNGNIECSKCGKIDIIQRLQIHEEIKPPIKNNGGNYRSYEDWLKIDNLKILCESCHSETESWCNPNNGK
jgi:hypothetical protein